MSFFKSKSEPTNLTNQKASLPAGYERIVFTVPWSILESKLPAAAAVLSQAKPLDGFRAGHVPVEVARQKYGDQALLAETYDLVITNLYAQEVQKVNLETIGQPKIEFNPQPAWGQDVVVTAEVPVLPKVKLPDLAKIKVQPVKEEVKDDDVDKVITDLCEHYAKEAAVNRPAQPGDLVAIDYQVSLAGVPVEGGSGMGHKAVLGRQHLLPEIEAAVVGMKPGEEKKQAITFAPTHPLKLVAGKITDCKITLKQLWERQLPELNDEWVATLGPFKKVEEFKERFKHDLEHEAEHRSVQQTEQKVLEAVIAVADYGVFPDILVTHETHQLIHELEDNLQRQGIKLDDYLLHIKKTQADLLLDFAKPALDRLKAMLLLRAIIKEHNLMPISAEVDAEVKRLTQFAKDPQTLQKPEVKENIQANLAQKKAMDWLKAKVIVA